MSDLHCNCVVERHDDHESDCLVGAIHEISINLGRLGNNDVETGLGAIDALTQILAQGMEKIARASSRGADYE